MSCFATRRAKNQIPRFMVSPKIRNMKFRVFEMFGADSGADFGPHNGGCQYFYVLKRYRKL